MLNEKLNICLIQEIVKKTNLLLVMKETILVLEDEFKKQNIKVKFDIKPEINISISFNELKIFFFKYFKKLFRTNYIK